LLADLAHRLYTIVERHKMRRRFVLRRPGTFSEAGSRILGSAMSIAALAPLSDKAWDCEAEDRLIDMKHQGGIGKHLSRGLSVANAARSKEYRRKELRAGNQARSR
jgi:hypothetical protein